MNDEEFTDRLRQARPQMPHRGAPLEPRHEAVLKQIMREPVPDSGAINAPRVPRARLGPVWLAAASVLFIAVIAVLGTVSVFRPQAAVAATPAILVPEPLAGSSEENLMKLGESVRATAHDGGTTVRFQTWALEFDPEADALPQQITPEEHELRHRPDGSTEIQVRAGVSYDANGDAVADPDPAPGTLLWFQDSPAVESADIFDEPPLHPDEFAKYFQDSGTVAAGTSGEYFTAVRLLLSEQTLSSDQEGAMIEFLAMLPDIHVDGTLFDRLDRLGVSFSTESRSPGEYRDTLVVSATDGVLSYESTYIGSDRTDLRAPAVIEYIAWQ